MFKAETLTYSYARRKKDRAKNSFDVRANMVGHIPVHRIERADVLRQLHHARCIDRGHFTVLLDGEEILRIRHSRIPKTTATLRNDKPLNALADRVTAHLRDMARITRVREPRPA